MASLRCLRGSSGRDSGRSSSQEEGSQERRQADRSIPVDACADGAGEPAVEGSSRAPHRRKAAHSGGGEVAVEVFEVFVAFGAVAGG